MSELWVFMAFVWIIAEVIGYFRKTEFSQRMETGAKWSVALVSLSTYGSGGADKTSLVYLASVVFLYTAVAIAIYFYRLKAFNFIKKQFETSTDNISESEKSIGKVIVFQFSNGLTQLIAIIAGFYTGVLINGLLLAAITLVNLSVAG
jgi:hypothetical protein